MEKEKLHNLVEEYCRVWIREPREAFYLHKEIDSPSKRTKRFQEFLEYVIDNNKSAEEKKECEHKWSAPTQMVRDNGILKPTTYAVISCKNCQKSIVA